MKTHAHGPACNGHARHGGAQARDLDEILERVKASGLKLTAPRRAVLKAVTEAPGPFTTEEIFRSVSRSSRTTKCDLVTVYRSLATFADLNLLSRIDFGDGVVRYEWVDPQGHHHHHFVCNSCARVEPLNLCEIKNQEKALKAAGYAQLTHRLEFFGLCPKCAPSV